MTITNDFKLMPSTADKHGHTAKLNLKGDGVSSTDAGHPHDILDFVVKPGGDEPKHTHKLEEL